MDFLILVDELHEQTGVEIPERDYPQLASVEGCVAYLAARRAAPAPWDPRLSTRLRQSGAAT
jgi:hypothetical protein